MNVMTARRRGFAAVLTAFLLGLSSVHAQQAAPDDNTKPVTDASKANEDDIAKESENPIAT
jgi:hypothetical protein